MDDAVKTTEQLIHELTAMRQRVAELEAAATERKQAEAALLKSKELFRQILESIREVIFVVNHRDYNVEYINLAYEELWGQPCECLYKRPTAWLEAIHPEDKGHVNAALEQQQQTGEFNEEFRIVQPDGTVRWIYDRVFPIRNDHGDIDRLVGIAEDITTRKQAEKSLKQAHDTLETRVAERTADLQRLNEHLHTEITERQQAGEQVRLSHEQLRALSTRLLSIQEEERRRIAGEVHDELGQALTALKLDLTWLDRHLPGQSEPYHQKTATMMQLLDTTIHMVRRIAATLRPRILDDLGLVAALEWQVQEFQARTTIACALTIDMEESGLDAARSTAVFRILQETLTNVARHAHATTVDISLRIEGETLHLEVRDNGSGISDKAMRNPQSLGLFGMRERLQPWGGALNIQGSQGQGTTVTVELPLDETKRVR